MYLLFPAGLLAPLGASAVIDELTESLLVGVEENTMNIDTAFRCVIAALSRVGEDRYKQVQGAEGAESEKVKFGQEAVDPSL